MEVGVILSTASMECRVPSRQLGVVAGTSSRVPPGREYRSGRQEKAENQWGYKLSNVPSEEKGVRYIYPFQTASVIEEDDLAVDTSLHYMVWQPDDLQSRFARHRTTLHR